MCGIAGIWNLKGRAKFDLDGSARIMADALRHRGPDDHGVWVDEANGIALAHRRLSILDLSSAGHQPMLTKDGRYTIVFNGEIYNHLELRKELAQAGYSCNWNGHSDTETLLFAIETWGVEKTLHKAIGMFAFGLWDRQQRRLWLARDRIGEKPLYYGIQNGVLYFCSELTALRQAPAFTQTVNTTALALYMRRGFVPAPFSIFTDINKLPAGSFIEIAPDAELNTPIKFWSIHDVARDQQRQITHMNDEDILDELERRLLRSVQLQTISDVPIGALLSGGIDSTLIVALLQKLNQDAVKTFSIGFHEREFDEAPHAREIATYLGINHTELYCSTQDAINLATTIPGTYDEPFADASQIPTMLVMKLVKESTSVVMSGDGGDEFFGGYNHHRTMPSLCRYLRLLPGSVANQVGKAAHFVDKKMIYDDRSILFRNIKVNSLLRKLSRLGVCAQNASDLEDLYLSVISNHKYNQDIAVHQPCLNSIHDGFSSWPDYGSLTRQLLVVDAATYLPDDIMVKVDRASMAVSLECRAPFLDRDVMELALSLEDKHLIRNGESKWALKKLLDRYVPRELMQRPKQGFSVPLDDWLRGPLHDWARDLLAEPRMREQGLLNAGAVSALWTAHQSGTQNLGYRIWPALMFQSWLANCT